MNNPMNFVVTQLNQQNNMVNSMAGQPNNMNNFNNQMQMNNNQYVYSMDNIKSDPFSLLNKIIGSIILDEHPHPLYSCFNYLHSLRLFLLSKLFNAISPI